VTRSQQTVRAPTTAPKLLVAATINRADLLALFDGVAASSRVAFIEYDDHWGTALDRSLYAPYGDVSTWREHSNADQLLDRVDPDRVVMLAISSREQVALRVAARERGIEVIHLEHGYRLPVETREALGMHRLGTARRIQPGVGRHAFFARSLLSPGHRPRRRLAAYAVATARGLSNERAGAFGDVRRPDRYVSFSPECFAFHRQIDRVPEALAARTEYVGVPSFDCFVDEPDELDHEAVALIDHQLHNAGIAGWNEDFHRAWAASLFETVCGRAGKTLYVKEHPGDRTGSWAPFAGRGVELIGSIGELAVKLRSVPTVLAGVTTLQIPAAALRHIALITLEIHPRRGVDLSNRFIAAGVAEPVRSFNELFVALGSVDRLRERQAQRKAAFIEQFLHRLDGRSHERLGAALLGGLDAPSATIATG
jgi:hypothetical protein